MAISITKLNDGKRNAVFHIAISGGGGELTDEVLIDPATDFDIALPARPGITLEHVQGDLTGFSARLTFDYLSSDLPIWSMSGDQWFDIDFTRRAGGLKDRSPELDGSGKLMLSTNGLGAGDYGTLIISVRKN